MGEDEEMRTPSASYTPSASHVKAEALLSGRKNGTRENSRPRTHFESREELAKELAREKALREVEEMRLRRGFQKTDVSLTGKMNDILKEHDDVNNQINQSKRRMNELRSSLDGEIQKIAQVRLGDVSAQ